MSDSNAVVRDEFFDSLLGDFLDESGQLLDRLNENLLQLDEWVRSLDEGHSQRCDDELMNDMFRSAHSLKGLSAMLGLEDINHLTHRVENVFDAARKDELIFDGDVVELMFQAVDRLVGLVDALKEPEAESVECESVIESIAKLLQLAGVAREQTSQEDAERTLQEEFAAAEAEVSKAEEAAGQRDGEVESPPPATETQAEPMPKTVLDFFQDLEDEVDMQSKYLSIFIDETDLSLDQLTETLLALEGGGSPEAIENLLITSHRIKGSAASIGLNRPAKLAHLMEDLLQNLVDTGRLLSPEVTDAMLKCSDALHQYVEGLKRGSPRSEQFNQLAHELLAAQVGEEPQPPDTQPAVSARGKLDSAADQLPASEGISEELRQAVEGVAADPDATFVGQALFAPDLPLVGLKARLLYEKLSNLGELCYFCPPFEGLDDIEKLDGVSFGLTTDNPLERVDRCLRVAGVRQTSVKPLVTGKAAPVAVESAQPTEPTPPHAVAGHRTTRPPAKAKAHPADSGSKPTETLRVDVERLDQLMNLAGQLVINKARFAQIGDNLKGLLSNRESSRVLRTVFSTLKKMTDGNGRSKGESFSADLEHLRSQARRVQSDLEAVSRDVQVLAQVRTSVNDLFETIHQLDRVSDGIQQSVMDTRMLPIGPLFTRFKRVIRDIMRSNGKTINLIIKGEKTELDKRMIDELGDPLIHMVRNSADHGIELPEVREAAGKPRQGTVTLDAFHRGNSIVIEVSDDGKGLDPDGIRRKALEKGLYSEADLDRMTPHQIYQLIWEPGLSTAEKVTEVSGRGMGMDIVKSKIEDLNGVVDLDSEPGRGTTLTIKLPLTLAILPSLMVEIDGDVFAMPLESVVEIVGVNRREFRSVHGQSTARVRGRVISTVALEEVFTWARDNSSAKSTDNDQTTLVIVGDGGREIGLSVDRVLGEGDIVIKSMAENYRNVAGIAGASILGNGRVSLILDLAALIDMASNQHSTTTVS